MLYAGKRAQRVANDGQRYARFRRQRRGSQRVFKIVRAGDADFFRGAKRPSADNDLAVLHVRAVF